MPVLALPDFLAAVESDARLVGFDVGAKTVGIATGDLNSGLVFPVGTLKRGKWAEDAELLLGSVAERDATGLVVGLPLNMDGSSGPRAQATRAFVRNLLKLADLPVLMQDERLTSAAADEALADRGVKVEARRRRIDAEAAALILEDAIRACRTRLHV